MAKQHIIGFEEQTVDIYCAKCSNIYYVNNSKQLICSECGYTKSISLATTKPPGHSAHSSYQKQININTYIDLTDINIVKQTDLLCNTGCGRKYYIAPVRGSEKKFLYCVKCLKSS